jgi:hypothetical protein
MPLPPDVPSQLPTHQPTTQPFVFPTDSQTRLPTRSPTRSPSQSPTTSPTKGRLDVSSETLTTFYTVADVPYNQVEATQLPPQVRNLPGDAEFLLV